MIDRTHDLPVVRQAELLELARSSVYYAPLPMQESDLRVMRRIDELHLEHPFAGADLARRREDAVRMVRQIHELDVRARFAAGLTAEQLLALPEAR